MQVYYGPFRALEKKFVAYAASLRPGPGRAVLVLCPSGRVAARLQRLLAVKTGLFSNVFFKTFAQLTAELDRETPAHKDPLLPGDALHDYLLKNLLLRPGLDRYRPSRGFIGAVRASLRDMADALADPDVLEEHMQTAADPVLQAETAHLQWLARVYRAYLREMEGVRGYRSYAAYFAGALKAAENSEYLHSFQEILVYGFYELTGRQLELFNALRAHYPVTAFWLYAKHPAFAFGRKFFEANILGSSARAEELEEDWSALAAGECVRALFTPGVAKEPPKGLCLVSAPDPEGELFFVVKEMLRLHEREGVAFADMAVTARSLEPYKTLLPEVFEQNGVPLDASFEFGLTSRPMGVFLSNLLGLARGGFERDTVLAVVTSPYFKKKNQWRYLIDESLARRDFSQWADLVRPSLAFYDPAFLDWLDGTRRKLEFLERALPWDTLRRAAREFLEENTDLSALSAEEKAVWEEAAQALNGFARYACAAPKAREGEFLDELASALQSAPLNQTSDMPFGVSAVDALNMRGLGFKAVFVLGLNEKIFPQVIREDPVLKDYYRRVLRDQLGFWINQKMERFDEERLLFFCAAQAAGERLYLSFLRADAEGKPLVPSGYLAELARAAGLDLNSPQVRRVSGRLSERLKETELTLLSEKELSLALAAQDAPPEQYRAAGLLDAQREESLRAARQIASTGAPGAYDGAVQSGAEIFAAQNASGFSPSALQDLARCPMKYFLAKGVGLKEKDEALSRAELAPDARGTAYHEVLMQYYQDLYEEGLFGRLFPQALEEKLDRALAKHYDAKSYKRFGIYPVIWELILKDIQDKLSGFVVQDAAHLGDYIPSVFETRFEKIYAPSPALKIKLKGIIDRIDVDAESKTFRVVDYKSGKRGGKDLAADMFKKVILQPFIYLVLAQDEKRTEGLSADGAALLSINKGYERQELTRPGFEAVRPKAEAFLAMLMDFVRRGRFFVNPGEHCQYCPYAAVCRKDAFRALLRAKHAPESRALEEAKQ